MYTSAVDLKEFYDTMQGRVVQRILRRRLTEFWSDATGLRLLGLGYPLPYLRPYMDNAERVAALMPAKQGAVYWPTDGDSLTCIYAEKALPIESNSVDRILMIHAFQDYDRAHTTMDEAWRVLSGQGRLLLVVPNRAGVWVRTDNTPFGHGTPFSAAQLRKMLKDHMFVPERLERALYIPPTASRMMLGFAGLWERIGRNFFSAFGGVHIIEATKQLYAGVGVAEPTRVQKIRKAVLAPPAVKPVSTKDRA